MNGCIMGCDNVGHCEFCPGSPILTDRDPGDEHRNGRVRPLPAPRFTFLNVTYRFLTLQGAKDARMTIELDAQARGFDVVGSSFES